jgi:hypothetical protein
MADKTCSTCKETKPLELFRSCHRSKDGRTGRCSICIGVKDKQYYRALTPEEYAKRQAKVREWRVKNPDKVKQSERKFYARNKDAENARTKKWRDENKEHVRETSKKWREKNKEYFYALCEAWRLRNMEHVNEKRKEWARNNPEKVKKFCKNWRNKNPDKVREMGKRAQVKRIKNLTDKYIVDLFKTQTGIRSIEVPPDLITAKRHYITIKRNLKEAK